MPAIIAHGRAHPWRLLSACLLVGILAGCATYEHHYELKGSGLARCGPWTVELHTSFQDLRAVALIAWIDEEEGRRAMVDEVLLVDSLVVNLGDLSWHRRALRPNTMFYQWTAVKNDPSSDYFRIAMLDSARSLASHLAKGIPVPGAARTTSRWEHRLVDLAPALPWRETLAPSPTWEVGLLDPLERTTPDELTMLQPPSTPSLWTYFPLYEPFGDEDERRLTFHVRTVDRRTAQVLETATLVFEQDRVGGWEWFLGR